MLDDGFFLVDKPVGPTSNRVLQDIKRRLIGPSFTRGHKFGHTGTLDSFASGLLIVLVGKLTRLTPWFMGQAKEYEAVVRFGEETDTLDPLGRVIATAAVPSLSLLQDVLPQFRGRLLQTPPSYSAVHVGGKRSYEIAKSGEIPDLAPRSVSIEMLELLSFEGVEARFSVRCSSGTYIRSLARDIGLACSSRAFVQSLRRTRIGTFDVSAACSPQDCAATTLYAFTPDKAHDIGLGAGLLSREFSVRFQHGCVLPLNAIELLYDGASVAALFAEGDGFIGLVEKHGDNWCPIVVALKELQQ
ncbi:MAG TPA: tRNA pseudouridine(55) synthase TruB [Spirochaetaceae bacterium]|nr:tRNA pseudouridine(55) synthase TruB [Spirochaetaceae bacterium]